MPTPPQLQYVSFENLARRWFCTVQDIFQYVLLNGLRVHAYIHPSKVLKCPNHKKRKATLKKLPPNNPEYNAICFEAENEEIPSNGYEEIKKEDVANILHHRSGANVFELVSDSSEYDKCLETHKNITSTDLYMHKTEVLRFERKIETTSENSKMRSARWAASVKDTESVLEAANRILNEEQPKILKSHKKGELLNIKTIIRELRRSLEGKKRSTLAKK